MCMLLLQLLLVTHVRLSSQLLAIINNATYVYIVRIHMFIYTYILSKNSPLCPFRGQAHKAYASPAFQQYHAKEIGYTTPIIFNWAVSVKLLTNSTRKEKRANSTSLSDRGVNNSFDPAK